MSLTLVSQAASGLKGWGKNCGSKLRLAVLHPPYPTVHFDWTGAQARPALHHLIGQPNYVELTRLLKILEKSIKSTR
jgi:hypothetical protein